MIVPSHKQTPVAVPLDAQRPTVRRSVDPAVSCIPEDWPLGKKVRQKLVLVTVVVGGTCCLHLQGRMFCTRLATRLRSVTQRLLSQARNKDTQLRGNVVGEPRREQTNWKTGRGLEGNLVIDRNGNRTGDC